MSRQARADSGAFCRPNAGAHAALAPRQQLPAPTHHRSSAISHTSCAASRASGFWIGLKLAGDVADASQGVGGLQTGLPLPLHLNPVGDVGGYQV